MIKQATKVMPSDDLQDSYLHVTKEYKAEKYE